MKEYARYMYCVEKEEGRRKKEEIPVTEVEYTKTEKPRRFAEASVIRVATTYFPTS